MKRVVSLVPSWTETLIEAGANVVGRTRFCIHPRGRTKNIAAVGGTKSFDGEKLRALNPDVIVLDREENTVEMYEEARQVATVAVTHVESVRDLPRELMHLAGILGAPTSLITPASPPPVTPPGPTAPSEILASYAKRFEIVLASGRGRLNHASKSETAVLHNDFPGLIRWIQQSGPVSTKYVYCIWKDPWMVVTRDTFIGSMLEQIGITLMDVGPLKAAENAHAKYPTLETLPPDATILLSSEPYPFATKTPVLPNKNVALVDGESFSWFGLRALRFLESANPQKR